MYNVRILLASFILDCFIRLRRFCRPTAVRTLTGAFCGCAYCNVRAVSYYKCIMWPLCRNWAGTVRTTLSKCNNFPVCEQMVPPKRGSCSFTELHAHPISLFVGSRTRNGRTVYFGSLQNAQNHVSYDPQDRQMPSSSSFSASAFFSSAVALALSLTRWASAAWSTVN